LGIRDQASGRPGRSRSGPVASLNSRSITCHRPGSSSPWTVSVHTARPAGSHATPKAIPTRMGLSRPPGRRRRRAPRVTPSWIRVPWSTVDRARPSSFESGLAPPALPIR
jgi:hypothetical protein